MAPNHPLVAPAIWPLTVAGLEPSVWRYLSRFPQMTVHNILVVNAEIFCAQESDSREINPCLDLLNVVKKIATEIKTKAAVCFKIMTNVSRRPCTQPCIAVLPLPGTINHRLVRRDIHPGGERVHQRQSTSKRRDKRYLRRRLRN